jgi:hypothetical protein
VVFGTSMYTASMKNHMMQNDQSVTAVLRSHCHACTDSIQPSTRRLTKNETPIATGPTVSTNQYIGNRFVHERPSGARRTMLKLFSIVTMRLVAA